jgi:hypothetical protein
MRRPRVTPSLVVASLALFLAAGGSGYAIAKKTTPQPRCAAGAVRGVAVITGDPLKGLENLSGDYSSAANLFAYRWNCSGGAVQIRKAPSSTAVDVRFAGNAASVAIVSGYGGDPGSGAAQQQSDGSFRVFLSGRSDQPDGNSFGPRMLPFVIVAL